MHVPEPIKIRILQIGDVAVQIEHDPGGLIPGTMAEGDQRKKMCLLVSGDFYLGVSGKF